MSRDVKALAVFIPYAVLVHPFNQFPADGETAVRTGNAMGCSHHPCSRPALHSLPWSDAHHLGRGIKRWASIRARKVKEKRSELGNYDGVFQEQSGSGSGSSGSHRLKVRLAATPMPARCFPVPPFSVPRVCSLRGLEHRVVAVAVKLPRPPTSRDLASTIGEADLAPQYQILSLINNRGPIVRFLWLCRDKLSRRWILS